MDAQKDSELKSSSFLIPSLILSPAFPLPLIFCLDICLLLCWTDKNRNDSIHKTEHVCTRYTKSGPCCRLASPLKAAIWTVYPTLEHEAFVLQKAGIKVRVLWCFCLVFGWQDGSSGCAGRGAWAEQEQHCGMGGRTSGQVDKWTATAGPQLGDTARGHCSGTLAWPRGSGHCWPSLGQGLCPCVRSPGADVPGLAWPRCSSGLLCLWVWGALLKQLGLQPKLLMIEKEENGNTLKRGCGIFAAMSQNSTTIV